LCPLCLLHCAVLRRQLACFSTPPAPASSPANSSGPLLPELAHLPHLERLTLVRQGVAPWAGIPREWLQQGAFPRLRRLVLEGSSLSAPLPDIPPGALPALERLTLIFPALRTQLPASWGSSPAVLPELQSLTVLAHLQGGLPEQWAHGFRQLSTLFLESSAGEGACADADDADAGAERRLPLSWPSGFPILRYLGLTNLGLARADLAALSQEGAFALLHEL